MAVQVEKPRRPKNVVLRKFAREAVQQVQTDFKTQHIWPTEIYPGFAKVNAERKRKGQWHATGQGVKSFQYEVMSAMSGNETIRIEYLSHLRFADMGIAGPETLDNVRRDRKSRYQKRYVTIWDARDGESHRPAIMRNMRRLEARMQNYLEDFYGQEVGVQIYRTFNGMKAININL